MKPQRDKAHLIRNNTNKSGTQKITLKKKKKEYNLQGVNHRGRSAAATVSGGAGVAELDKEAEALGEEALSSSPITGKNWENQTPEPAINALPNNKQKTPKTFYFIIFSQPSKRKAAATIVNIYFFTVGFCWSKKGLFSVFPALTAIDKLWGKKLR